MQPNTSMLLLDYLFSALNFSNGLREGFSVYTIAE